MTQSPIPIPNPQVIRQVCQRSLCCLKPHVRPKRMAIIYGLNPSLLFYIRLIIWLVRNLANLTFPMKKKQSFGGKIPHQLGDKPSWGPTSPHATRPQQHVTSPRPAMTPWKIDGKRLEIHSSLYQIHMIREYAQSERNTRRTITAIFGCLS